MLRSIRCLTVVSLPLTGAQRHMRKARPKGGVLRAAGIDAEADLAASSVKMADTHLTEVYSF